MKKIIILGAGRYGSRMAQMLVSEGHDLTLIDIEPKSHELIEKFDVSFILGDASDKEILSQAGIEKVDFLIALTNKDEVNILGCLLGKRLNKKLRTIARINERTFYKTLLEVSPKSLAIDFHFNPQSVVVHEINNLILYSEAQEMFELTKHEIIYSRYLIKDDSPLLNLSIGDLTEKMEGLQVLLLSITVDGEIKIPDPTDRIESGSAVGFLCMKSDLSLVRQVFGYDTNRKKDIYICGGNLFGQELASIMGHKHNVKIIEKSEELCQQVADRLSDVMVLEGSCCNLDLLRDEGIEDADAFVALYEDDQVNIMGAQVARFLNVKATIITLFNTDLSDFVSSLGISKIVTPRMTVASSVLKYIEGESVYNFTRVMEEQFKIVEHIIPKDSKLLGMPISEINVPSNIKIGMIIRKQKAILPKETEKLHSNDHIIAFCIHHQEEAAKKFFSN